MLTVLFLSATLTTGMSTISHAKEIDANELTFEEKASLAQYDETFLARQSESAEDYQVLQDMISAASYSKSNNSLTENYGGAYIDGSGSLVVYLKETDDNSMRQLDEIDNDIIVKPCQYTLDDLTNIMDQINAYKLSGTREFADEFNYYALSDSENKIIVELEELTDENMEKFKKEVCDSEAITFEQATD